LSEVWHAKKKDEVLEALDTRLNGLSSQEVKERLVKYGPNKLVEKGGVSPLKIFLGQFKDVLVSSKNTGQKRLWRH